MTFEPRLVFLKTISFFSPGAFELEEPGGDKEPAIEAVGLRPLMRTGLKPAVVFRLAAPRGLTILEAAACTAAPRPNGRPAGISEAPILTSLEAAEDTGEPLSMPGQDA